MPDDEIRLIGALPNLRRPILLAAFAGWNDAGEAATFGLETLVDTWSAAPFAEIDPENYLDFTDTRPMVSLDATGQRSLDWPTTDFYGHRLPEVGTEHDVALLIGTEPNLRWKTYCRCIISVAERIDVSCLVTLGALLADVPHTRDPIVSGSASASRLLPQLQKLGVQMSGYEGPTGIIGALHDAWRATELPAISMWGSVPHYISATPNPQVALALLRRVQTLLSTPLPLAPIEKQARAFGTQVNEALRDNPEVTAYVRQLEEQHQAEEPLPEEGPDLIDALEEFLRTSRPQDEGGSP
jgi:proteasome assembly chaperone (PAC2) family protein